jgi:hypothetical protein
MTALLLAVLLAPVVLLHLLWAIGLWWPIRDEARLVATVVGVQGMARMPGAAPCALVATAELMLAAWPLVAGGRWHDLGLWAAAAVLGLRGVAAWLPGWRRLTPVQPFATYDRRLYGPFCLILALLSGLTALAGP